MRFTWVSIAAVSARLAASAASSSFDLADHPHVGYIIELEPSATGLKRGVHESFHKRAEEASANYTVRHEFTNPEYFHGLSVNASHEDATVLAALPEVKNIWPNWVHARLSGFRVTHSHHHNLFARGETVDETNNTVVHITGDSDITSSLKMADVDKVHKLGITGKGVKVGVIDSGIDYRHPALGGGFGEGFKVAGGYDLVGEDYTGYNDPVPDDDPLVTCLDGGHGTHVSGIIAAQDPDGVGFGVLGVAPDASLYMYRIFSCEGSATDDVIMQGFEKAANDGVDVISMSAGYAEIWETDSPYTSLMQGIIDKGIGVVIAAGNDGQKGPYYASTPALVPAVIAVGSVANTKFTNIYHAADSMNQTVNVGRIVPVDDAENDFHVFTVPNEDTSCTTDDWTNASEGFSDKQRLIAFLAANSTCSYTYRLNQYTAATNITEIWWEADPDTDLYLEEPGYWSGYNVSQIDPKEADKIRAGITQQGSDYTVSFKDQSVHDEDQWDGGSINFFSTFGPTMEMSLKPQISAPGGNILNTWVITGGIGYAIISGTSMATPFLAGVYALVKSSNSDLTPEEIRTRLQNSAIPMIESTQPDILSTTVQQGAGLVNALNAINYATTTVSPSELNLRDSSEPISQTITIENNSKLSKTYTLGHRGAGLVEALPQIYSTNPNAQMKWVLSYTASYATAKWSSDSVTVSAGSKATVQVSISPPTDGVDVNTLPIYGGYLTVESSDESIVVPYAGVPYDRDSVHVLDTTNLTALDIIQPGPPAGVPIVPSMYAYDTEVRNNDIETYNFVNGNFPSVFLTVRQPSAYVRLDVVPVDTDFKPDYYGYNKSIPHSNFTKPSLDLSSLDNFLNVSSYGAIAISYGDPAMPAAGTLGRLWAGIGSYSQTWDGALVTLNNGTSYTLPNADYRVLLRVLKWGFDWNDADNYESWLSPIARIQQA